MIFVTVGTHGQPFQRLVDALEALPADELVVQYGHARPPRGVREARAFMPFPDVVDAMDRAEVVVTHAGVGSFLCAMRLGHTPVVVPRRADLGEHVDDHQSELIERLAESGSVIPVFDTRELPAAVAEVPPRRSGARASDGPLAAAVRAALLGRPLPAES